MQDTDPGSGAGRPPAADLVALQNRVLSMIAAGEPLDATLVALAQAVESLSPGTMTAILLLEPDGRHLRPVVAPGCPAGLAKALGTITVGEGNGASGTAAARKETVVVEDAATDPLCAGLRPHFARFDVRGSWATPILSRDRGLLGTVTVSLSRPGGPEPYERRVVEIAAQVAAIAVTHSREEEALRESEARYRLVSENGADVIWLYDLAEDRFTFVSPSIERLRGYTVDEVLRQPLRETLSPESYGKATRILADAVAGFAGGGAAARTRTFTLVETRKDGSTVPTEVSASLIADASGRVTHVQGVTRDISDRLSAEQTRAEEAAFRDAVFEASSDGIAVIDQQHRVVQANARFAEMLGYERHEVLGLHTWDWEAVLDEAEIRSRFADLSQIRTTFETRHRRRDGSLYDAEVSASGLSFGGEAVVLTISRDIAARKQAEAARARLQEQLLHAQKMESVGRLAGGVAHNFNNMLSVIQGHASLALERLSPGSGAHEDLLEIQRAVQRSTALTRQLLAFARRQPAEPRRVDLNELVGRMRTMLTRLSREDVELVFRPAAELWAVFVDPSQVDQLLANLCANARDAISGTGTIVIETANVAVDEAGCVARGHGRPGDYVALSVSDDGCGMDEDVKSHLFEPFFTTKGVGRGTGLGLASVYGIVQQNGGFVEVESAPGRGSTFRVHFPRFVGPPSSPRIRTVQETPRGQGETVLVVEDEAALLRLATLMLEGAGYRVLPAGSPAAALSLAEAHAPELRLLLTDVVMPGMNGRELADRVRALVPGLPCLFMSGYSADVVAHRGLLSEGVRLLGKPFTRHELVVRVREALREAGAAGARGEAGGGGRVLFVDDEEGLCFLMTRALGKLGHAVTAHSDASDALAAFRQAPGGFDLVVTDLSMPAMSGLALTRKLLEASPGVRVVVISGYVSDEERQAALAAGARTVLLKSTTVDELAAGIDREMRGR